VLLGSGGDQQVRYLSAPLAPCRQKPLSLASPSDMGRRRLDEFQQLERTDQLIPLLGVAGRESHFEVGDTGPGCRARLNEWLECRSHGWGADAGENAGVDKMGYRHASSRSKRGMRASRSIEWRTTSDRSEPTSRSASFTVALIVVVPSCDRAALSASSSMSTSRLVICGVYINVKWVYTNQSRDGQRGGQKTQHFTQQLRSRASRQVSAGAIGHRSRSLRGPGMRCRGTDRPSPTRSSPPSQGGDTGSNPVGTTRERPGEGLKVLTTPAGSRLLSIHLSIYSGTLRWTTVDPPDGGTSCRARCASGEWSRGNSAYTPGVIRSPAESGTSSAHSVGTSAKHPRRLPPWSPRPTGGYLGQPKRAPSVLSSMSGSTTPLAWNERLPSAWPA
jgi:hypothetical protein